MLKDIKILQSLTVCVFSILIFAGCSALGTDSSDSGDRTADEVAELLQGYWLEDEDSDGYISGDQPVVLLFDDDDITYYLSDDDSPSSTSELTEQSEGNVNGFTVEVYQDTCDCWFINDSNGDVYLGIGFESDDQFVYLGESNFSFSRIDL